MVPGAVVGVPGRVTRRRKRSQPTNLRSLPCVLVLKYDHTFLTLFQSRGGIYVPSPGLWLSQQWKLFCVNPSTRAEEAINFPPGLLEPLLSGSRVPVRTVPLPGGCRGPGPLVDSPSWDSSLSLPRQTSNMGRKKRPDDLVPQGSESHLPSPARTAALPRGDLQAPWGCALPEFLSHSTNEHNTPVVALCHSVLKCFAAQQ